MNDLYDELLRKSHERDDDEGTEAAVPLQQLHVIEGLAEAVADKYSVVLSGKEKCDYQIQEMQDLLKDYTIELRRVTTQYNYVSSELKRTSAAATQRDASYAIEKQQLLDHIAAREFEWETERADLLRQMNKAMLKPTTSRTTQTTECRKYNRGTNTSTFSFSIGTNTSNPLYVNAATATVDQGSVSGLPAASPTPPRESNSPEGWHSCNSRSEHPKSHSPEFYSPVTRREFSPDFRMAMSRAGSVRDGSVSLPYQNTAAGGIQSGPELIHHNQQSSPTREMSVQTELNRSSHSRSSSPAGNVIWTTDNLIDMALGGGGKESLRAPDRSQSNESYRRTTTPSLEPTNTHQGYQDNDGVDNVVVTPSRIATAINQSSIASSHQIPSRATSISKAVVERKNRTIGGSRQSSLARTPPQTPQLTAENVSLVGSTVRSEFTEGDEFNVAEHPAVRVTWPVGATCRLHSDGSEGRIIGRAGGGFMVLIGSSKIFQPASNLIIDNASSKLDELSTAGSPPPARSHSPASTLPPSSPSKATLREQYPVGLHPAHYKCQSKARSYTPKRKASPRISGC